MKNNALSHPSYSPVLLPGSNSFQPVSISSAIYLHIYIDKSLMLLNLVQKDVERDFS